jgi:hypothetical protein
VSRALRARSYQQFGLPGASRRAFLHLVVGLTAPGGAPSRQGTLPLSGE